MRVALLGALTGAGGCAAVDADSGGAAEIESASELAMEAAPGTIEFGETSVGETYAEAFTVKNVGLNAITITAVEVGDAALSVALPAGAVEPGDEIELTLVWTPTEAGTLREQVVVEAAGGSGAIGRATLDVVGVAEAAKAQLSATIVDFGYVNVGCSASATWSISNTGPLDLVIDSFSMEEATGLSLGIDGAGPPPLPWAIESGDNMTFTLDFTPLVDGSVATSMNFTTNDTDKPTVAVPVTATGIVQAYGADSFTVSRQRVTVLFAANQVMLQSNSLLLRHFPTFVETLQGEGIGYRVALVHSTDGRVAGSTQYIDDTMDADDATEALEEMAAGATGDNDYLLQTLASGIYVNADWLLDEDPEWAESKLNLVGLNTDMEQSSGDYVSYVTEYRTYKANSSDIVVHGIGGDVPRGCTGSPYTAEPFQPFSDAAAMTGGVFLSVCESDWTAHMEALASACMGETGRRFALSQVPQSWSLRVRVDSVVVSSGWSYDDDDNAVVFDPETPPAVGSDVDIDYVVAVTCD